tara:strand:- start:5660 stop:6259 length:600 start_codon:yes stop_codon:yes gene_type:complete
MQIAVIGTSLLGLTVLGSIANTFNPHAEMSRAPSMPLIAGDSDSDSDVNEEIIKSAIQHRREYPTLSHAPSDYFPAEDYRKDKTPRIKFINLLDKRVKFTIHPVTWSRWFLSAFKCMIPTPVGSIGVEGDVEKETVKNNEVRLAPISKLKRRLPDICEFPIPGKKVYVSMYVDGSPVFVDRKMKAFDTFICRSHTGVRA